MFIVSIISALIIAISTYASYKANKLEIEEVLKRKERGEGAIEIITQKLKADSECLTTSGVDPKDSKDVIELLLSSKTFLSDIN